MGLNQVTAPALLVQRPPPLTHWLQHHPTQEPWPVILLDPWQALGPISLAHQDLFLPIWQMLLLTACCCSLAGLLAALLMKPKPKPKRKAAPAPAPAPAPAVTTAYTAVPSYTAMPVTTVVEPAYTVAAPQVAYATTPMMTAAPVQSVYAAAPVQSVYAPAGIV